VLEQVLVQHSCGNEKHSPDELQDLLELLELQVEDHEPMKVLHGQRRQLQRLCELELELELELEQELELELELELDHVLMVLEQLKLSLEQKLPDWLQEVPHQRGHVEHMQNLQELGLQECSGY
jgi:hypothetical protein